ncbi:major facilitator superfamily transporter [Phlyctema vagabunda]|uniref:Major facilitator superfamily transporter n=1 Tax=Phlyctema vagabunda TaxID=108571 RepID=A0ABR4PYV2_9HELO
MSVPAIEYTNQASLADEENAGLSETSPLLKAGPEESNQAQETRWKPPPGFLWIEIAIFANVFLYGFDGTITASTYAVIGSEFNASNNISWLTTSYLITSTAFQPLYGRFSDILGRRACFFTATITFLLGCLGCGLVPDIVSLNLMRALTGLGGGGLMTMATIINSDMIPFKERGMYQACQNVLHGFGSICGASLGGWIADTIGWRWCFLCQAPISIFALGIGHFVVKDLAPREVIVNENAVQIKGRSLWKQIDLSGALLLVLGLSTQLAALSMGGNNYPWSDWRVITSLIVSILLLGAFVVTEIKTKAIPIMPMSMFRGRLAISNLVSNFCVGTAAYAFLFMIPLFFQVVLRESASQAGIRLVVPSIATPIGGLIAGFVMSRFGRLSELVRLGCFTMIIGNGLVASLKYRDSGWKYVIYLFPANLGQGIVYPSILFTSLAAYDHSQQAVATSIVYLVRSLGTVWGVAATSSIIQNVLATRLPDALSGIPNKEEIIAQIRHSVTALDTLPQDVQDIARRVYFEALRFSFIASTLIATIALISAFFARGRDLNRS